MVSKKILLLSAIVSVMGSGYCSADDIFEQTINNAMSAQQANVAVNQPVAPSQPSFPAQAGQPAVSHAVIQSATSATTESNADLSVLADKVNPFTGEPMTVEDRKNVLSAVSLDAQILDKKLEVAKKQGELEILPTRIKNQLAVEQGASTQGAQQDVQQQLALQAQVSQAEIDRRVQEEVRKASLEKEYEIQTLKNNMKEKAKADSQMGLGYVGNVDGNKSAVIKIGNDDFRVKEGGPVGASGWVVTNIDINNRKVTLNKRGRNVVLNMKRTVSYITTSAKPASNSTGYQDMGDPIVPNMPNALPLPSL